MTPSSRRDSPPQLPPAAVVVPLNERRTQRGSPPLSPPAVWAAFARHARWKSWVLLGQMLIVALLVLTCLEISKTQPDVVVVDAGGRSHYVPHSVASEALVRFLAEQKGQPSDVTVLNFTERFLRLFLAPNSSTIREASREALSMMDRALQDRTAADLLREQTVEKVAALQIRTELETQALDELERAGGLIHLRARVTRTTSSLLDGSSPFVDGLEVEVVERTVPRSPARPDGLEIAEVRVATLKESPGAPPTPRATHVSSAGASP